MAQRLFNKPNPSNDAKLTGWYKTKDNNQVALRVGDNDLDIDGTIRFKHGVFEGYDGTGWIQLNAEKGDMGLAGQNFNEIVNIETNKTKCNLKSLKKTERAELNIVTHCKPPHYTLEFRNIIGGKGIELLQDTTTLMIQNVPQPYCSSITNNSISNLKSKYHGDTTTYIVAPKCHIKTGEAVQIISHQNKLYIKTVVYDKEYLDLFNSGVNILGIALESSREGQSCQICTKGICNIIINNENSYPYISSVSIKLNNLGIVSKTGGIMNIGMKPLDNFISAGYFLEEGNIGKEGSMVLFYVDPRIHYL